MANERMIPAGMKPWAGGDAAPADWDGGPVLLDTRAWGAPPNQRWCETVYHLRIIAYTPRTPTEPGIGAADEREAFDQRERADWGDLHRLQQRGPNLIKPRLGGHIVRWAADEITALRAALERTAS